MPTNQEEWQARVEKGLEKWRGVMSLEEQQKEGIPLDHVVISRGYGKQLEKPPKTETKERGAGLGGAVNHAARRSGNRCCISARLCSETSPPKISSN